MTELLNLLPATETVCDHDHLRTRSLHRRKQLVVRDDARHAKFVGLKSEGSGHPAAAGSDQFHLRTGAAQQRDLIPCPAKDRLVMAMTVNQNALAVESRRRKTRPFRGKKISQQPDLPAQATSARVGRKQLQKFVAKDAGAAWLEKHEWQSGLNLRCHLIEHARKVRARCRKQTEVVERSPAAEVPARRFNCEARRTEH